MVEVASGTLPNRMGDGFMLESQGGGIVDGSWGVGVLGDGLVEVVVGLFGDGVGWGRGQVHLLIKL